MQSDKEYIHQFQRWVSEFIVDLNICPFARREVSRNSVRYVVTKFENDDEFYATLCQELQLLDSSSETETTLLLLPQLTDDFEGFLNQAGFAEQILHLNGYEGVYQIANFHPDYVFADSAPDDAANYSNRAPCPALHLLREASLTRAIDAHKNAEQIPDDNVRRLREIGLAELQARLASLKT
ncbi:DUF1415 domain-containing protein [Aliidiomarina sp. Khilg15.8]